MPIVSTKKMTAQQYKQLGEDPPGVRLELVNGEVAVSPSPTPEHSNLDVILVSMLHTHVAKHQLGCILRDSDTIFGPHDVRRPDILYFSSDRVHLIFADGLEGLPDLAVEIVSPSSSTIDRVDKFDQYEAAGLSYYWLVDPKTKSIEGYKLRRGKYVLTGRGKGSDVVRLPPFPDLDIPLATLWLPDFRKPRRKSSGK